MSRHPRAAERAARKLIPAELPAGHAREEAKKVVADELAQQGEQQFANATALDPSAFEIDREAAYVHERTDGYEVKNAQEGYVYCWVREDKPGSQVQWKRSIRVCMPEGYVPLWEVVQSDMPEAPDEKDVRGYRKIVDCILMRARKERFEAYTAAQARLNALRERGASEGMEELARKSKGLVRVYNEADISNPTTLNRAMAQGMARAEFTRRIREGTAHHI